MTATRSISFLTWNLGQMQTSNEAPATWTVADAEAALRAALATADADVIALQEVPNEHRVPTIDTHRVVEHMTRSHSGLIATMVRGGADDSEPSAVVIGEGHTVMMTIDSELTVANVHLAPFKANADVRFAQVSAIVDASPTEHLLVIGDTNTTVGEMKSIATLGLKGERPPEFTINWRKNRFYPDEHGPRITTYYTRWLSTEGVDVSDITVWSKPLPNDQGKGFYLSDHFALSGRAEFLTR